ncbi:hypothetical protein UPYG_G00018600 [Umbra pygmaea]|uniref:CD99 molecule n=1 Tax=Umbra pygmaea TaxID=75934 RepID=A0ABD0Y4A0_UMBPY
MKSCLWIALLATLLVGIKTQEGFDLSDAVDDPTPAPAPKAPTPEPKKPAVVPPKDGGTDPPAPPPPPPPPPPIPAGDDFDLSDALGPDPEAGKPAVVPPKDGGTGGGDFGDDDLFHLGNGADGYKPDPGTGGRKTDVRGPSDNDGVDNSDQPQEAGSGQIAGIASAIGVAILGAASSYFAYQKKKLCFKIQGGVDPESGKGVQSDPQVMSNLLK